MRRVVVIGAGAAGLMGAIHAARAGADVTVLERNEKAGKKIYLTGKGRCNVTNNCDREEFLAEVAHNPRFLYSALSFFSPADMMKLLEENGCPVMTQRGRRVFPVTEKASDVTKTLVSLCGKLGVRIHLRQRVTGITTDQDGAVMGVHVIDEQPETDRHSDPRRLPEGGQMIPADAVIIATGDVYFYAKSLGHTVLPPIPSLVGLEAKESWPMSLQGLSLKNVSVTLKKGKKTLYTQLGEMLFTHFGFSGPLILEASCHLPEDWPGEDGKTKNLNLELDLKPGLTREQLDARLLRDLDSGGKKQLRNLLPGLLPARLGEVFPALCGLPEHLPCNQVTAGQREALLNHLKTLPLKLKGRRPIAEAVVTRGGVPVKEVSPGTMESRIVSGLYLAGEILDVDAHTGGYNLQTAFATGALAGHSAGT